jgi:CO/xanthine dehydrogenase Mo-binding subunit
MVAVAPTILNALYDATGHEFFRLPVFPKDILEVLR